jgi:hypothetical protein
MWRHTALFTCVVCADGVVPPGVLQQLVAAADAAVAGGYRLQLYVQHVNLPLWAELEYPGAWSIVQMPPWGN